MTINEYGFSPDDFFIKVYKSKIDINKLINQNIFMFVNKMNKIKATLLIIFLSLISMNAHSAEQKPLISLYVLGENKNNKSSKYLFNQLLIKAVL